MAAPNDMHAPRNDVWERSWIRSNSNRILDSNSSCNSSVVAASLDVIWGIDYIYMLDSFLPKKKTASEIGPADIEHCDREIF
jgi:hypothetical protein